jgi:exodeoxyribonuclease VII small subunit
MRESKEIDHPRNGKEHALAKRRPAEGERFEKRLEELEGIVSRLEAGDVPLEESLELFTRGTGIMRELARTLEEAERKVEILTRDAQGRLVLAPFRPANGAEGSEEDPEDEGK